MRVETDKFIMEWMIPNRVILMTYKDSLDKADLESITKALAEFHEASTFPVHIISDNRQMGSVNANLATLRDAFGIMQRDGWGWMMLVGTDQLVTFFAKMVTSAFGLDIRRTDSPDEALASLKRLDQTLASDDDVAT